VTSRLTLEYDGRAFAGWSRQPGERTVQEEVERALAVVLRQSEGVAVTVAGRTDAGVHALGQVCSYDGPPAPLSGLNALLPADVAALDCARARDGFDARHDATSRAYCYRVLARPSRSALWASRALHWPGALDVGALRECASALLGVHDFTAFTPTQTEHIRFQRVVLAAEWTSRAPASAGDALRGAAGETGRLTAPAPPTPGGELLEFWIEADAFMRHMNRVLVGTMLEVAGGRRSAESFVTLLGGRPRSEAGPTAPAHGLYLAGVGYEGQRVLDGAPGELRPPDLPV
jgi:tRNA pseudouridine38-40 synthase